MALSIGFDSKFFQNQPKPLSYISQRLVYLLSGHYQYGVSQRSPARVG